MKSRILRELKRSLLLPLWLLLVQAAAALVSVFVMAAVVIMLAMGVQLPLLGSTPLWEWIAVGVLICLFWLLMGWLAPNAVRPGPVGSVVVLAMWAVVTSLMRNMYVILFLQRTCGGMLVRILWSLGCESWNDDLTTGCFLLSAMFGIGLLFGWKRTAAAVRR